MRFHPTVLAAASPPAAAANAPIRRHRGEICRSFFPRLRRRHRRILDRGHHLCKSSDHHHICVIACYRNGHHRNYGDDDHDDLRGDGCRIAFFVG